VTYKKGKNADLFIIAFAGKKKMSSNKPHASIGLPVFNGEEYLAKALNSITTQNSRGCMEF